MQTININLVREYKIKSLCIDNFSIVEELYKKCFDYYILVEGVLPKDLIIAAANYAKYCEDKGTDIKFIKHAD